MVTQACNYECVFCHKEGQQIAKKDLLLAEDYRYLFSIVKENFGWNTTTLTGGEPLVRCDIEDIIAELYKEGADITITTNGFLLQERLYVGNYIRKINLSMHTMKPNVYENIVQRKNSFHKVVYGIKRFRQLYPDVSICLNLTLVRGVNSDESDILDILKFAESINADVKFIELFPPNADDVVPSGEIEKILIRNGFSSLTSNTRKSNYTRNNITASITKIFCAAALQSDDPGMFCKQNNDLFVSPDGKIKPCRFNMREVDLLTAVKLKNDYEVIRLIMESIEVMDEHCSDYLKKIRM